MIKCIDFNVDTKYSDFEYVKRLPAIEAMGGRMEFKDGLNIIVGANGSGKSSVLNVISYMMAANLSGSSLVSRDWLQSVSSSILGLGETNLKTPAKIEHDGRPVLYCNPRKGISAEVKSLDGTDFGMEALLDSLNSNRESSGEKSNRLMTPLINTVLNSEPPDEIQITKEAHNVNDFYAEVIELLINDWFKPSIPKGKATLILDEPETGLGILNQILLWNKILKNPDVLDRYQIILVSHSHECINIPGANYIEMKPGYLDACRKALTGDFDYQDTAEYASNIFKKLNKRQSDLMLKIHKSSAKDEVIYKDNQTFNSLIQLDLIDTYKPFRKSPKTESRDRGYMRRLNPEYVCELTHKGVQYIKLHGGIN